MRLQIEAVPEITIFVRHSAGCLYADDETHRGCRCRKHLRWFYKGGQERQSAKTRSWAEAEKERNRLILQFGGRVDESVAAIPATDAKRRTVKQEIATHLSAKTGEGLSPATLRKLKYQLGLFQKFLTARSKFFPSEITATDVIEFRSGWESWKSGVTRQKAQQNLRGFLRLCCTDNLSKLLAALKPIKLSKTDKTRLKPMPFSEDELQALLAQVPKEFSDPIRAARLTALIHCQVSTGLAIRDAVQLERSSILNGVLRIERQKSSKPVIQKLDSALYQELLAVTNGNPKYVFWDGKSLPTSATGLLQEDLRVLMKAAGLWIKGNLSHRFRDTAVDYWLEQGCSLTEVAAMLGSTVRTTERHYADLASKRMGSRLAKIPTRSWDAATDGGGQ